MQKRDRLEALLEKITSKDFATIWKDTYGYDPRGKRAELAKVFAAEQYDRELDGCIAHAESLLAPAAKPKRNPWLSPR